MKIRKIFLRTLLIPALCATLLTPATAQKNSSAPGVVLFSTDAVVSGQSLHSYPGNGENTFSVFPGSSSGESILTKSALAGFTIQNPQVLFSDVPSTHWAYANIREASDDGVIKGYADGTFAPAATLSLAHFTVILTRGFYADELNRTSVPDSSPWYAAAESVALSHNLLSDVDSRMEDPLSRYGMAVELYNLLTDLQYDFSTDDVYGFIDSIQDLHLFPDIVTMDAVLHIYALGILGGYDDGCFHGENILNRAQAAAIYCRLKNVLASASNENNTPVSNPSLPADPPVSNPSLPVEDTPAKDDSDIPAEDYPSVPGTPSDLADETSPSAPVNPVPADDATPTDSSDEIPSSPPEEEPSPDFISEVLRLVNEERQKEGLHPLSFSDELLKAAQIRADELPENFSHTRPDGKSCFTVLSEVGVSYRATGENIAAGQQTPEQVMDSWMNSSGHRANILGEQFSKIGIGRCETSKGYGVYWVQLFTN